MQVVSVVSYLLFELALKTRKWPDVEACQRSPTEQAYDILAKQLANMTSEEAVARTLGGTSPTRRGEGAC